MRATSDDWKLLANAYESAAVSSTARASLGALLDLEEVHIELAGRLEDLKDREGFTVRLEALKAAREHIASLESEQRNDRGYRDHAMKPAERIAAELKVAGYLLGEDQ